MDRMKALVVKSIDAGALGVSTGLAYAPGSFVSTDELIAFTQPVGAQNRFYFSHIRNEDEGVTDAVAEAILIGRKTNAAVQISHLKAAWPDNWDKAVQCLELIDAARDDGIDVAADVYPYQAASQRLVSLMPLWSREGGQQAILKRFASAPIRREIEISMKSESPARFIKWDRIMVCGSPKRPDYQGRYIDELATEEGKAPFEWVCDALVETELDLMIIMFISSETNVELIMQHPAVMIGTDGTGVAPDTPLYSANVHPRNYGTFAKALGHYVREKKLCRLEEMIRKMTGQAAERFHLTGRGFICRGNFADVVVFDPERVVDMATFENPHQYPHGICHVIVNGQFVIKDGEHTQKRPGHILRF
jgi:N-acyl-D-amino-acid deacylase